MTSDMDDLGAFGWGIRVVRRADGNVDYQPHTIMRNIPIEIVIMQMHVFLETLKKDYADRYGKSSTSE